MRDGQTTNIITVLLIVTFMWLSTGCAGLAGLQPLAFRGSPVSEVNDRSTPIFSYSGGGTIGVSGGLLIDQFEKNHWARLR
jgi:hypothetical protein